jgi:hypothetical protein
MKTIIAQYVVEALAATAIVVRSFEKRDPRKVLVVVESLDVLRVGGVLGALAALRSAPVPWFLAQVALGDAVAAASALIALVLLVRRSPHASTAIMGANTLGLLGIVVSETCLQWLESSGRITRATFLHGPTIAAAMFTALHVLAFRLRGLRATTRSGVVDASM